MRIAILAIIFFVSQGGHTYKDDFLLVRVSSLGEIHYRLNNWLEYNATDHVIVAKKGYVKLSRAKRDSLYQDASHHLFSLQKKLDK